MNFPARGGARALPVPNQVGTALRRRPAQCVVDWEMILLRPRAWLAVRMLLILLPGSQGARAWGPEGHQAVGMIATNFMTPAARAQVDTLLAGEQLGDQRVTSWADYIRGNKRMRTVFPNNDRWHYLDTDVHSGAEACQPTADGNDVVSQVERWQNTLADAHRSAEEKRDAVRFLAHFVGDLHQPLHCAHREDDRGGNLVPVQSFHGAHFSITMKTSANGHPNLHRTWDDYLVFEAMAGQDVTNFAHRLAATITPDQVAAWSQGRALDWARESHQYAVSNAYLFTDGTAIPSTNTLAPLHLNETNYVAGNTTVAALQLQKAGVRLARLLNAACDADPDHAYKSQRE